MQNLIYDVAREFIKTGNRIEPKYHPPSWYFTSHSTNVFHIGKYSFYCHYEYLDNNDKRTTVHILGHIPFEIANAIYEKFKDEKDKIDKRPIFEYDGGKSLNPSLVLTDYEMHKARTAIARAILQNPRIAYFFPKEIAEKVLYRTDSSGIDMCVNTFDSDLFIKNMQQFEKREKLDIDSIILYTMEELEFTMELIRAE